MSFYIKDNLPIPHVQKQRKTYDFAKLEPGQSMLIPNKRNPPPGEMEYECNTIENIANHVSRWNKKSEFKLGYAIYPSDNQYIQVWRKP